jgi:hypothetical protein
MKAGVLVSLLIAAAASVWSVQKISLVPFKLTPRALEMATASTHVVVDTPDSALLDLRQDTYSLEGLRNRAVLLGNVMASTQVQQNIARRAGVPVEALRVQAPLTKEQSAPAITSENARKTSDILKSMDQYRVNIQANPTVPMLDIYVQTPDVKSAAALANAAVAELKAYLATLATSQRTPAKDQIHLVSLGQAEGVVINQGAGWQVALLAFLITFAIACGTVIFLGRLRAGWRAASVSERSEREAALT